MMTMSNNKQDSIEFLWEELKPFLPKSYTEEESIKILSTLKQAKAMHKEEMKNFTEDWYHNGPLLGVDVLVSTSIEKHYNETFGGNNEQ